MPLRIAGFLTVSTYLFLVVTLVLLPAFWVFIAPAALINILSLPVGIVAPNVGHRMAEWAPREDRVDSAMDAVLAPLDRLWATLGW